MSQDLCTKFAQTLTKTLDAHASFTACAQTKPKPKVKARPKARAKAAAYGEGKCAGCYKLRCWNKGRAVDRSGQEEDGEEHTERDGNADGHREGEQHGWVGVGTQRRTVNSHPLD
eukprot:3405309-Pyramimonas_sp.AAC.2